MTVVSSMVRLVDSGVQVVLDQSVGLQVSGAKRPIEAVANSCRLRVLCRERFGR